MAKFATTTLFKASTPRAETPMDKTTRAATEILNEETEQRKIKTKRLRKARLGREAGTPVEAPKATSNGAGKKPRARLSDRA